MRVTNEMIESKIRTLNAVLNRPATMFADDRATNNMNVGHIMIDYSNWKMALVEIANPSGGEINHSGHLSKKEMLNFLNAIFVGLKLQRKFEDDFPR